MYETSHLDDQSDSSEDGQGKVLDKAKEHAIKHMIRSKSCTDQRFINMVRVKQAKDHGVKIGFKGLNKTILGNSTSHVD